MRVEEVDGVLQNILFEKRPGRRGGGRGAARQKL